MQSYKKIVGHVELYKKIFHKSSQPLSNNCTKFNSLPRKYKTRVQFGIIFITNESKHYFGRVQQRATESEHWPHRIYSSKIEQ